MVMGDKKGNQKREVSQDSRRAIFPSRSIGVCTVEIHTTKERKGRLWRESDPG